MAALPKSTETVLDPGLGVVAPASTTPVFIGTASSGTENSFALYSTKKALTDAHGYGPAVEAALQTMTYAGGPVGFVRSSTTTAASNGSVTVTGTTPTPVLSGSAVSDYSCKIEILSTGALGAATFRYTLDSAAPSPTYSGTQTVPSGGAFVLGESGVTCTFQVGSHVAGDTITFDVACAAGNATDTTTALNALDAATDGWRFVYVVTSANTGDNTAHAAIAGALDSSLDSMATNGKYRRGMMAANRDDSSPTSDWAAEVQDRVLIAYGSADMLSGSPTVAHAYPRVSITNSFAARAAGSLISTDLKRVPGNGLNDGGPLPGVAAITKDARVDGGESWDDIKLSSARTYLGRAGRYITQGRLKSADGSDFTIWPRGIVMDVACETVHDVQTGWIGIGVRTNDDGTIDERDALRLEAVMNSTLSARLTSPRNAEGTDGHVSAFRYTIDRNHNVATTSTIQASLAIRPLANIDYITTTVGFAVNLGQEVTQTEEG